MRTPIDRNTGVFLLLALLLLVAGVALVHASNGYSIHWFTIDSGGGNSKGGDYTLNGTSGQPDAGELSGGEYTLGGGFWGGGAIAEVVYLLNLPMVTRDNTP